MFYVVCVCKSKRLSDSFKHGILLLLLPARSSEPDNVIGSVRIYIYICVCTKKNCN